MAIIEFEDVSLEYPLRHDTMSLKEYIVRGVFRKRGKEKRTRLRALDRVSFQIKEDERVAIIGSNGAGKSTLLRTVAGIYPICSGKRTVVGSICSLYDITLGFEMDSTGWENIYYRGYLQGETPRSIRGKIQEIADFCELGEFLDLPLRCYSAGMVMRLAFSIATSSEPEILLIDEVFGTGDLSFQKKAETRIKDYLTRAKIVVSVSHNLEILAELCQRGIWMKHGQIQADGPIDSVIASYLDSVSPAAARPAAA
jgi:ABC-type polysaccharide/polyol phosphate transport system ATPase subunit